MSLDTCYSLDSDVENYENFEEDTVFEIPVKVVNLKKNLDSDEWSLVMSAEELHYHYHAIRDIIIYGES